jgi:hypothetical protein
MLEFKALGFTRYDWGGLFEDGTSRERAGINNFKREFGGEQTKLYEAVVPLSVRGRIYLPIRAVMAEVRRRRYEWQSRLSVV